MALSSSAPRPRATEIKYGDLPLWHLADGLPCLLWARYWRKSRLAAARIRQAELHGVKLNACPSPGRRSGAGMEKSRYVRAIPRRDNWRTGPIGAGFVAGDQKRENQQSWPDQQEWLLNFGPKLAAALRPFIAAFNNSEEAPATIPAG